jgi:acetyl-CoA acetyltransferase
VAPLWPDTISLAALQARALLDAGKASEKDFAEVATRSRRNAQANPNAQLAWDRSVDDHLASPLLVDPLRKEDCPPITDGACAVVLAAGDRARELRERPAWIRGIAHEIEPMALGMRDLTTSASTTGAASRCSASGGYDVVELHAPFSPQELILRDSLGLRDHDNVNPSGGALSANPVMVAGLTRIGEVAQRIMDGDATRGLAHATSGPCLQQNLVCVLEGES